MEDQKRIDLSLNVIKIYWVIIIHLLKDIHMG